MQVYGENSLSRGAPSHGEGRSLRASTIYMLLPSTQSIPKAHSVHFSWKQSKDSHNAVARLLSFGLVFALFPWKSCLPPGKNKQTRAAENMPCGFVESGVLGVNTAADIPMKNGTEKDEKHLLLTEKIYIYIYMLAEIKTSWHSHIGSAKSEHAWRHGQDVCQDYDNGRDF